MAHRTKPKKPEMTPTRVVAYLLEQLQYSYSEELEEAMRLVSTHIAEDPKLENKKKLVHVNRGDQGSGYVEQRFKQWSCPVCGHQVGERFEIDKYKYHDQRMTPYCSNCGKKIRWEGVLNGTLQDEEKTE